MMVTFVVVIIIISIMIIIIITIIITIVITVIKYCYIRAYYIIERNAISELVSVFVMLCAVMHWNHLKQPKGVSAVIIGHRRLRWYWHLCRISRKLVDIAFSKGEGIKS